MKKILLLIASLILLSSNAFAEGQVNPTRLLWELPTTNVDGTPVDDLGGTKVYRSSVTGGPYILVTTINDPTAVEALISTFNLAHGQHYVVITAIDLAGNESVDSNQVAFFLDKTSTNPHQNVRTE